MKFVSVGADIVVCQQRRSESGGSALGDGNLRNIVKVELKVGTLLARPRDWGVMDKLHTALRVARVSSGT